MGTHHQVPGLLGDLHPRGLQAPQMPSPHACFLLLSPSEKRRAGKMTRGRCVLLWDDCVPFISYDLKVRRHGQSLAQEKRQNRTPLVLRIQVMEELTSDGWSFLSHLQKSHQKHKHTCSNSIQTKLSRTLTQTMGMCPPISHLASGHHFTLTHFDGRSTGSGFWPTASYFKDRVSITEIGPVSRSPTTPTNYLFPFLSYPCFLLLRLIFHFKPHFSSLLHYVDYLSPWQPSPPHQPRLGMGPQAGAILVLSISQSVVSSPQLSPECHG